MPAGTVTLADLVDLLAERGLTLELLVSTLNNSGITLQQFLNFLNYALAQLGITAGQVLNFILVHFPVINPPPPPLLDPSPAVGGITFEEAAPFLARVVDNGVCVDDDRVMIRTNEATKIILDYLIPVGGMMTADVLATG